MNLYHRKLPYGNYFAIFSNDTVFIVEPVTYFTLCNLMNKMVRVKIRSKWVQEKHSEVRGLGFSIFTK